VELKKGKCLITIFRILHSNFRILETFYPLAFYLL